MVLFKSYSDGPRPWCGSASHAQTKKAVSVPKNCYATVVFLSPVIFVGLVCGGGWGEYSRITKMLNIVGNILVSM